MRQQLDLVSLYEDPEVIMPNRFEPDNLRRRNRGPYRVLFMGGPIDGEMRTLDDVPMVYSSQMMPPQTPEDPPSFDPKRNYGKEMVQLILLHYHRNIFTDHSGKCFYIYTDTVCSDVEIFERLANNYVESKAKGRR